MGSGYKPQDFMHVLKDRFGGNHIGVLFGPGSRVNLDLEEADYIIGYFNVRQAVLDIIDERS